MEDERQVQVGDKRPHSPDENSSQVRNSNANTISGDVTLLSIRVPFINFREVRFLSC
jgi:hypothetical protein